MWTIIKYLWPLAPTVLGAIVTYELGKRSERHRARLAYLRDRHDEKLAAMRETFNLLTEPFLKSIELISMIQAAAQAEDEGAKEQLYERASNHWSELCAIVTTLRSRISKHYAALPPDVVRSVGEIENLLGSLPPLIKQADTGMTPEWNTYRAPITEAINRYHREVVAAADEPPF